MVQEVSDCHLGLVIDVQSWLCSVGNSRKQGMQRWQKHVSLMLTKIVRICAADCLSQSVFRRFSRQSLFLFFLFPAAESNCTYFKFFTTGENTVMFQKTTKKSESLLDPFNCCPTSSRPHLHLQLYLTLLPSPLSLSLTHSCVISPLSPSALAPLSLILAALFQAAHCLFCECLKFIPPTLRSSVSELQPNLSFHWQLHNVKITDWHALNEDRCALKPPSGCTSLTRNAFFDVDWRALEKKEMFFPWENMETHGLCWKSITSIPVFGTRGDSTILLRFKCGHDVIWKWSKASDSKFIFWFTFSGSFVSHCAAELPSVGSDFWCTSIFRTITFYCVLLLIPQTQ